jgi:hypothetical protein
VAGASGEGATSEVKARAVDEVRDVIAAGKAIEADELPEHLKHLPQQRDRLEIDLKREFAKQELELRETYAKGLLAILAVELVLVNVIFWKYAATGKHWNVPDGVIQIWLGATVVQVVGVVTVVTRYLFPSRDKQPN